MQIHLIAAATIRMLGGTPPAYELWMFQSEPGDPFTGWVVAPAGWDQLENLPGVGKNYEEAIQHWLGQGMAG